MLIVGSINLSPKVYGFTACARANVIFNFQIAVLSEEDARRKNSFCEDEEDVHSKGAGKNAFLKEQKSRPFLKPKRAVFATLPHFSEKSGIATAQSFLSANAA